MRHNIQAGHACPANTIKGLKKKEHKNEQNDQAIWHEKAGLSGVHMYKQNLMPVVTSGGTMATKRTNANQISCQNECCAELLSSPLPWSLPLPCHFHSVRFCPSIARKSSLLFLDGTLSPPLPSALVSILSFSEAAPEVGAAGARFKPSPPRRPPRAPGC